MGGMAARMAGSAAIPKENKNGENNETEINTNINRNIVDPNDNDQFSGTNIVEGIKNFYNLVDQSGLLNEEKVNETKENLFNIAEENKNNDSESNGDPKFLSYSLEGVNPLQNIFNYNPEGNIGFDIGNKDGGFFATGDADVSLSGLDTNLQAGFKNENFNIGYNPEGGFNYGFNRQFGDNTNLGINQSGVQLGTQFGDNTDINLAYNNGNFNPSLNTNIRNTDIALNPNKLDLNRTFEIGDNTNVNLGGEVNFDGQTKADLEVTKDFLNKKLQLYGGVDTEGDYNVGAKFNFLNL
tara:strand:+ start:1 stop:888 length:888 start_codon:yes stop_codon:yes gene_type:complete